MSFYNTYLSKRAENCVFSTALNCVKRLCYPLFPLVFVNFHPECDGKSRKAYLTKEKASAVLPTNIKMPDLHKNIQLRNNTNDINNAILISQGNKKRCGTEC